MPKRIIEISNSQHAVKVDSARLKRVATAVFRDAGIQELRLSIAVVDDPTIHRLNREFLAHDYATDALSFLLERQDDRLEGEIVVSGDTARSMAAEVGWPAADELLLYVIHGALHLVGFDDTTPHARATMRKEELRYLALLGVSPPSAARKPVRPPKPRAVPARKRPGR